MLKKTVTFVLAAILVMMTCGAGSADNTRTIENGIQFKYAENEDDFSWLYGDDEATATEEESADWLNP